MTMAKLVLQDHRDRSVDMATMEYMAAGVSNEDAVACKGDIVLLIRTNNGGSALRYEELSPLGEDVVSALKATDCAFKVIEPSKFKPLMDELVANLEDEGLLDVEVHAFQFGSYYGYYETTA